jgi:hypothetical protein
MMLEQSEQDGIFINRSRTFEAILASRDDLNFDLSKGFDFNSVNFNLVIEGSTLAKIVKNY